MLPALAMVALAASAPEGVLFALDDPRGDDRGPGTYTYPTRPAYPPRTFDLRRFVMREDGDHIVFEARFERPLRPPVEQARRTRAIEIPLDNALYVKHVDIYLRTEDRPGVQEGLPGRRIRFANGGWHRAIVLTPRPFVLRSLLEGWPAADRVLVPSNLVAIGPTVRARIPRAALPDSDPHTWGVAVTVSGALWENRFDVYPEAPESYVQNALTMPVRPVADFRWFGGGGLDGEDPHVIDVLAPTAEDQYRWLRRAGRARARLPFLFAPDGPRPRAQRDVH